METLTGSMRWWGFFFALNFAAECRQEARPRPPTELADAAIRTRAMRRRAKFRQFHMVRCR